MSVSVQDILFFDELYQQILGIHGKLLLIGPHDPDNQEVVDLWLELQDIYESSVFAGGRGIGTTSKLDTLSTESLKDYLSDYPYTIIALAYVTVEGFPEIKECLEAIQPFLTTGSIVVLDKLNDEGSPGQTLALKEVWGLNTFAVRRSFYGGDRGYIVVT